VNLLVNVLATVVVRSATRIDCAVSAVAIEVRPSALTSPADRVAPCAYARRGRWTVRQDDAGHVQQVSRDGGWDSSGGAGDAEAPKAHLAGRSLDVKPRWSARDDEECCAGATREVLMQ
jgi:hypothetical protein